MRSSDDDADFPAGTLVFCWHLLGWELGMSLGRVYGETRFSDRIRVLICPKFGKSSIVSVLVASATNYHTTWLRSIDEEF